MDRDPHTGTEFYVVWRRNDGYVGASANYFPRGWHNDGQERVSFEELARFHHSEWHLASALIDQERAKLKK